MALLIRRARAGDQPALLEQFLGLNRHEDAIAGDRRTDRRGAAESLAAAEQEVAASGGAALVAEFDGQVAGHLFLVIRHDAIYIREHLRTCAFVSDLFVREPFRDAGIATALMQEAERIAASMGLRRLFVGVLAGNVPAETLYARLGFRPHAIELEKNVEAG